MGHIDSCLNEKEGVCRDVCVSGQNHLRSDSGVS